MKTEKGQTLVISIIIMFLLAVLAGVFIAIVAKNLARSERSANTDALQQIAEAGITYADKMLVSSEDGADWRPVPDNLGTSNIPIYDNNPTFLVEPVATSDWVSKKKNPDFKWIRAYWPFEFFPSGYTAGPDDIDQTLGLAGPTGGYTKFDTGDGRFLLRVSYNPDPDDSMSKNIKLESIGRWGVVIDDDPTTLLPNGNPRMRREVTAYKPIGITNYMRFITNKDKRSMDFSLGCEGYINELGRPFGSTYDYRTGPIRVNGNLAWFTNSDIYLRGIIQSDDPNVIIPVDAVEVAGDIKFATGTNQVILHYFYWDGSTWKSSDVDTFTSDDNSYTTSGGFYRDGSDLTDASRSARGIKRIEPPIVDQPDLSNTTVRYRLLTLNSGTPVVSASGRLINPGIYGWGRGVYINNSRDTQNESETLFGGYTLRNDWLNPDNRTSSFWQGPYYNPPGVIITLNPGDTDNDGQPDFIITRTDTDARGRNYVWYDASGNVRPEWGSTIIMPYPNAGKNPITHAETGRILTTALGGTNQTIPGNGVIYAEGNIRIKGMLPPDMQLTIVSNENIYIEGNLLKNRTDSGSATDPWRGADERCSLSLLARGSVCVNTTQFFAPGNSLSSDDIGSDAQNSEPPFHVVVSNDPASVPRIAFDFGPYESETGSLPTNPPYMMMLRHSGQYGPAYIDMWLNQQIVILNPLPNTNSLPEYLWGIGDPNYKPAYVGKYGTETNFAGDIFPLDPLFENFSTTIGARNLIEIALDQSYFSRNNYLLGGLVIQPMDIRIEAVIYAQEGSFFVIPGQWFNTNPSDTDPADRKGCDPEFPMYGQPLDIRIIVDGAISENISASASDVQAWMTKWGMIPNKYGSSSIDTAHPGEGFIILYDDHAGWPITNLRDSNITTRRPIRTDDFGRPLPFTPKLPVSPTLIYSGDEN